MHHQAWSWWMEKTCHSKRSGQDTILSQVSRGGHFTSLLIIQQAPGVAEEIFKRTKRSDEIHP